MGSLQTQTVDGQRLYAYKHETSDKDIHVVFTDIAHWNHGIQGMDYDKVWMLRSEKDHSEFGDGEISVMLVKDGYEFYMVLSRSREVYITNKIPRTDGKKLVDLV